MHPLHAPMKYPQNVKDAMASMPPLATEIANRWMLGWPDRVTKLLETGQFLPALKAQEEAEREAYSSEDSRHLARHEIAELNGLSAEPPV